MIHKTDTVAILAQGTSWAVADMQAFCLYTTTFLGHRGCVYWRHACAKSIEEDEKILILV